MSHHHLTIEDATIAYGPVLAVDHVSLDLGCGHSVGLLGPDGAEDLAGAYRAAHFARAADFFEEGLNSAWLLPNRLYESGFFGAPALALSDVETGRWLADHACGVLFDDLDGPRLRDFFRDLDAAAYGTLERATEGQPWAAFGCGQDDCVALVRALAGDDDGAPVRAAA